MKKRLLAVVCALVLAVGLLLPWSLAAGPYDDIYLVGVNDTVLLGLISAEQMPVRRSGTIYAPCTVLDHKELGLSYALNRTAGTFTVYNRRRTLIFQLNGSGSADKEGNELTGRILTRNGVVFIPLRFVANFFELEYSFYNLVLPDGTVPIARLCGEGAAMTDQQFGAQAAQLAAGPLAQYLAAQASAAPSGSVRPSADPSADPSPSAAPRPVDICFAVACTDGAGFQSLLASFDQANCSALFLFSPDDLAQRDRDIRAAAAAGHQIGLLLPAQEPEAAFRRGNEQLRHILRSEATQVAFTGAVDESQSNGNWWVWQGNVTPRGRSASAQAANLLTDVDAQRTARVTLHDSRLTAQALRRDLSTWRQRPYALFTPTESGQ